MSFNAWVIFVLFLFFLLVVNLVSFQNLAALLSLQESTACSHRALWDLLNGELQCAFFSTRWWQNTIIHIVLETFNWISSVPLPSCVWWRSLCCSWRYDSEHVALYTSLLDCTVQYPLQIPSPLGLLMFDHPVEPLLTKVDAPGRLQTVHCERSLDFKTQALVANTHN